MSDTHKAVVDAAPFYQAVANAALFASTDDTLPALTAVRLCPGEPGQLRLEATNRYIASREHLELIDPASYDSDWDRADITGHLASAHDVPRPAGYDVRTREQADAEHKARHEAGTGHEHTVRPVAVTDLDILVDVKALVKITKMLRQLEQPGYASRRIVAEHADGDGHAAFTLTGQAGPDQTLRAETVDGTWPGLDRFFDVHRQPGDLDQPVPVDWSVSSKWLAVLAKVGDGEKTPVVDFSFAARPGKPILASVGERFRATIMPWRKH